MPITYNEPGVVYNDAAYLYSGEPVPCETEYNESGYTYNKNGLSYAGCLEVSPTSGCNVRYNELGFTYNQERTTYFGCTHDLMMQARISRQQGWPIPDVGDPGLEGFTDTRLRMRAAILGPDLGLQTLRMKAKIRLGGTFTLDMLARIVTASHLQMRARITGRGSSRVPMQYDVSRTSQTRYQMLFYVEGNYGLQTLQVQAFIAKRRSARLMGHFIIAGGSNTNKIGTFTVSIQNRTEQSLRIGAGIIRD